MTPQWPTVTPWVIASGDQFRPGGPTLPASDERAALVNEVKADGDQNSVTSNAGPDDQCGGWASADSRSRPR